MAIVSISQIKHRRGKLEDLPQLASGELGWATDSRRLFIGNGLTNAEENAPEIGNTEVLTEYSNLLDQLETYTYKGAAAGYNVFTGRNQATIVRTMQEKFDDIVNVKDFGAVGDGSTDDTAAINRALNELFCRELNVEIRRALYFPAGTYLIGTAAYHALFPFETLYIKIPTYATMIGDGMDCTFIKQSTTASTYTAILSDNRQQTGTAQGLGGGITSKYIDIRDITFQQELGSNQDVFLMDYAIETSFSRVKFQGPFTSTVDTTYITSVSSSKACLRINSLTDGAPLNVRFTDCEFNGHTYGVVGIKSHNGIKFDHCYFNYLYTGCKFGESPTSTETARVNITNSVFDKIFNEGIHGYGATNVAVTSAFNTYLDVGTQLAGSLAATALTSVIKYESGNCASFGDYFARTDACVTTSKLPRVDHTTGANFSVIPGSGLQTGYYHIQAGKSITLLNNISAATTTGITFIPYATNGSDPTSVIGAWIDYAIIRSGRGVRAGTLILAMDTNGVQLVDNVFANSNGSAFQTGIDSTNSTPVGVTFTATIASGVTTVYYTTTSTGQPATMRYQIRYFS